MKKPEACGLTLKVTGSLTESISSLKRDRLTKGRQSAFSHLSRPTTWNHQFWTTSFFSDIFKLRPIFTAVNSPAKEILAAYP